MITQCGSPSCTLETIALERGVSIRFESPMLDLSFVRDTPEEALAALIDALVYVPTWHTETLEGMMFVRSLTAEDLLGGD